MRAHSAGCSTLLVHWLILIRKEAFSCCTDCIFISWHCSLHSPCSPPPSSDPRALPFWWRWFALSIPYLLGEIIPHPASYPCIFWLPALVLHGCYLLSYHFSSLAASSKLRAVPSAWSVTGPRPTFDKWVKARNKSCGLIEWNKMNRNSNDSHLISIGTHLETCGWNCVLKWASRVKLSVLQSSCPSALRTQHKPDKHFTRNHVSTLLLQNAFYVWLLCCGSFFFLKRISIYDTLFLFVLKNLNHISRCTEFPSV